ncbi:MAG: hypothetical protein HY318_18640 [Armatimonadetes bacterium]|nr:hypothetical protein [Armatimonadota bacterium]
MMSRWVVILLVFSVCGSTMAGPKETILSAVGDSKTWVKPGSDALQFSGQPVSFVGDSGPRAVAAVLSISFVAKGYRNVGTIGPSHPKLKEVLGSGWFVRSRKGFEALVIPGSTPAEIRCTVPTEAAGMVVTTFGAKDSQTPPVKVTLNGTAQEFVPLRGPREVCFRLTQKGDRLCLAQTEPIYNLWAIDIRSRNGEGGVTKGIDLSPENEPLSSGQYVLHVKYALDLKELFKGDAIAEVSALDLTPYDGYTVAVKTSTFTRASCQIKTTDNFSWRGGGQIFGPNQWGEIAVPFVNHANLTTAGDGVLKLAEIKRIHVSIVPQFRRGGLGEGEFWVRAPQFFRGNPPSGVQVARLRSVNDDHCDLVTISPERRNAPYFNGLSVQSIAHHGDIVWLGTNNGVIKVSQRQPGLPMAKWTQAEGLLDDDVQAVHPDGDNLWIGTVCGLSQFDGKAFHNYTTENGLLPGPVMALAGTPTSVWLGMTRGIARIDKTDGKVAAYKRRGGWAPESTGGQGVPVEEGRAVYADSMAIGQDGSLWHGAAGVDHTSAAGRPLEHFLGSTTRTIAVYPSEDVVWVVSAHGIQCMRQDGDIVANYPMRQRMGPQPYAADSRIVAAYPEKDTIWVAYNDGLGWLSLSNRTLYWSPSFSVSLGSLVPQCLMADEDSLWVGTDNGLVVFNKMDAVKPWRQLDYNCPADVYAAGLDLEDEALDSTAGIQRIFVDPEEGAGNAPGSLCMEFALGKDPMSACALEQRFGLDLTGYDGLSFSAKTTGSPRRFYLDLLRVDNPLRSRATETYRVWLDVPTTWKQFVIPFSALQRTGGKLAIPADTSFAGALTLRRVVGDFKCPEDKGKVWFDSLQWLKPGEKPTPSLQPVKEARAN